MKDRIKEFMDQEGLSSSELADLIGVQRSNISHILSGRNNPGYSFIEKLLQKFPDLDARWLILGEESILRPEVSPASPIIPPVLPGPIVSETGPINTKTINQPESLHTDPSEIEKIVILYRNKTFTDFSPGR